MDSFAEEIDQLRQRRGTEPPSRLKRRLQDRNWRDLLFVRSAGSLARVQDEAQRLDDEMSSHLAVRSAQDMIEVLELKNMLTVTKILAQVALMRQETRGSHYRVDFPDRNDSVWRESITVRKVGSEMQLGTIVPDPDWEDQEADASGFRWG